MLFLPIFHKILIIADAFCPIGFQQSLYCLLLRIEQCISIGQILFAGTKLPAGNAVVQPVTIFAAAL